MKVAVMVGCDEWMMGRREHRRREKLVDAGTREVCRVQCDSPFDVYTIAIHFEPREE